MPATAVRHVHDLCRPSWRQTLCPHSAGGGSRRPFWEYSSRNTHFYTLSEKIVAGATAPFHGETQHRSDHQTGGITEMGPSAAWVYARTCEVFRRAYCPLQVMPICYLRVRRASWSCCRAAGRAASLAAPPHLPPLQARTDASASAVTQGTLQLLSSSLAGPVSLRSS